VIKFQDAATLAAARAHIESWRWRLGVSTLFAIGAALTLNSWPIAITWLLAIFVTTGFDSMLGRSYLDARGHHDRETAGGLFVWGCAFSVIVASGLTLHVAAMGGGAGRVLGVLMAASAFVSAMMFLFQARGFMMITAAPAAFCLLAVPFLPMMPSGASLIEAELGAACGVGGFLFYVMRAAYLSNTRVDQLRAATLEARSRQAEAAARQSEAEAANKAKSEFLTVMTHELRTPLNAVIGYAEIIQEEAGAGNGAGEDAARIERSARHLLGLIDQILLMTGVDSADVRASEREVDIRALIENIVAAENEHASAAGNRISMRVSPEAERVYTDASRIGVCVAAILSNAVKFTSGGLIAVTATRQADQLVIAVSDTGVGIDARHLDEIFIPFRQIENAKTRARGGLGLGLAVARRVAQALGGDVSVTSEAGKGSTFTLRTPCGELANATLGRERPAA
jgi:signal transduction histidine kinase